MRRARSAERIVFSLSLIFVSVFYGFCAAVLDLFPAPFFRRAMIQAAAVMGPPHYAVPIVHPRHGARTLSAEAMQPGPTLITSVWEDLDWAPGLKLVDAEGRVLHSWHVPADRLFPDAGNVRNPEASYQIHGAYLLPGGDVVVNVEYIGTVRLDACGNVLWTLREANHHSIAAGDSDTFWIPATTVSSARPASADHPEGYPGLERPIPHDRILQVSATGEILRDISVLDALYANGLQRYLMRSRESPGRDLTHLNDVEPLGGGMASEYPLFEEGDLLLSLRNPNLVLVMDPQTLLVKWHTSEPFVQQHDPDFVGGGWVGVFDNNRDETDRGTLAGGSRIVMLQPHTDSMTIAFPGEGSEPFYTAIMGKWQLLENGNLLLTEAQAGRVMEVDSVGRTVWEWITDPFDDGTVVEVSEGSRHSLTPTDISAWQCASSDTRTAREDPAP